MNKEEVQKRVLRNGEPLALNKFTWCKKTKTFSSKEIELVIDFSDVHDCTFKTGSYCTFKTGSSCTFKTGFDCTFRTGSDCTFKTGSDCTFKTGLRCTFKTGSYCTFNTGFDCTFKTGLRCTFDTGSYCTFNTGFDCTFKTGLRCTFNTGSDCTFDTGFDCVIVRRDEFEVIQPNEGDVIQTCPYGISGHLVNGIYNGKPHIIADGILSEIRNQKGDVYKVINHGESETSFLIKSNDVYSHGKTIKDARESLIYKISDRDTTPYERYTKDSVLSFEECVKMYRIVTGACEGGVRSFVESQEVKDSYALSEIIDLTKGQFGHNEFVKFLEGSN